MQMYLSWKSRLGIWMQRTFHPEPKILTQLPNSPQTCSKQCRVRTYRCKPVQFSLLDNNRENVKPPYHLQTWNRKLQAPVPSVATLALNPQPRKDAASVFYGNPIVALLKDRRDSSLKAMRSLGLCVGVETLEGVLGARRGGKEALSGKTCLCNFASADFCCLHELGSEHGTLWWVDGRCGPCVVS